MLSEVLPYLEVVQGNPDQLEQKEEVKIPNIVELTLQEAEKVLKETGLEININNETEDLDKSETTVRSQIPEPGITVYKGSCVYIDY